MFYSLVFENLKINEYDFLEILLKLYKELTVIFMSLTSFFPLDQEFLVRYYKEADPYC